MPHGLACVQHYRELNKLPVFSHDELICTIYMHEKNPKASRWLFPFFKEMVEREIASREHARQNIKDLVEVALEVDAPDSEAQCVHCKCYCFLSQVVSTSSPYRATCIEHSVKVLGEVHKTMRIRYSDDDLRAFLKKVKARADKNVSVNTSLLDDGEARKSGRKRVPTAAALEAAGQDVMPLAQRQKLVHSGCECPSLRKRAIAYSSDRTTVDGSVTSLRRSSETSTTPEVAKPMMEVEVAPATTAAA